MTIKVTSRHDPSQGFELTEHTGPILRIDLSANNLLASYSGDGTIKIWDLIDKKCIKTLSGFGKLKSYQETEVYGELLHPGCLSNHCEHIRLFQIILYLFNPLVTPSFEPKSGKFMAYNRDNSIIIVDTQNWSVKKTLTDEKVTICAINFIDEFNEKINNKKENRF